MSGANVDISVQIPKRTVSGPKVTATQNLKRLHNILLHDESKEFSFHFHHLFKTRHNLRRPTDI
jgi:hypothetical protein